MRFSCATSRGQVRVVDRLLVAPCVRMTMAPLERLTDHCDVVRRGTRWRRFQHRPMVGQRERKAGQRKRGSGDKRWTAAVLVGLQNETREWHMYVVK